MTLPLDQPDSVRAGEALDVDALTAYLRRVAPADVGAIAVQQFRQGHSNLTYLVTVAGQDYVLRRPPFGNRVKSAHDMSREFRVLSALAPVFSPAPRPWLLCEDEAIIGAPFYLMERRQGAVFRRGLPVGFEVTPNVAESLCRAMVGTLASLHGVDYRAVGLEGFGKPAGYVGRQVKGWADRYQAAQTESVPDIDAIEQWLAANQPTESGAAVVHNDYKFDNVMFDPADPSRIVAVLDWELATVGDPLMDLGTVLCYWIHPDDHPSIRAFTTGPTSLPGMWSRTRFAEEYFRLTKTSPRDLTFYFAFGLYRLAVVLQQIYARYARGFTKDERFATMNGLVAVLARESVRAVERGIR